MCLGPITIGNLVAKGKFVDKSLAFNESSADTSFRSIGTTDIEKCLVHGSDQLYQYCSSKRVNLTLINAKKLWSCLMWAYFELLRLYTNVWVEPINIDTRVPSLYRNQCADTKFHV